MKFSTIPDKCSPPRRSKSAGGCDCDPIGAAKICQTAVGHADPGLQVCSGRRPRVATRKAKQEGGWVGAPLSPAVLVGDPSALAALSYTYLSLCLLNLVRRANIMAKTLLAYVHAILLNHVCLKRKSLTSIWLQETGGKWKHVPKERPQTRGTRPWKKFRRSAPRGLVSWLRSTLCGV